MEEEAERAAARRRKRRRKNGKLPLKGRESVLKRLRRYQERLARKWAADGPSNGGMVRQK